MSASATLYLRPRVTAATAIGGDLCVSVEFEVVDSWPIDDDADLYEAEPIEEEVEEDEEELTYKRPPKGLPEDILEGNWVRVSSKPYFHVDGLAMVEVYPTNGAIEVGDVGVVLEGPDHIGDCLVYIGSRDAIGSDGLYDDGRYYVNVMQLEPADEPS